MNAASIAPCAALPLGVLYAIAFERAQAYGLRISVRRPSAIVPGVVAIGLSVWATMRGAHAYPSVVLLACSAVSATTDLQTGYIFDRVLLAVGLATLPWILVTGGFVDAVAGGLLAALLLMIPFACSRGRGIGLGDVKLAATLGFALGTAGALAALWVAAMCGGAAAIALVVAGRASRGSTMPFGSFLALGASFAVLRFA